MFHTSSKPLIKQIRVMLALMHFCFTACEIRETRMSPFTSIKETFWDPDAAQLTGIRCAHVSPPFFSFFLLFAYITHATYTPLPLLNAFLTSYITWYTLFRYVFIARFLRFILHRLCDPWMNLFGCRGSCGGFLSSMLVSVVILSVASVAVDAAGSFQTALSLSSLSSSPSFSNTSPLRMPTACATLSLFRDQPLSTANMEQDTISLSPSQFSLMYDAIHHEKPIPWQSILPILEDAMNCGRVNQNLIDILVLHAQRSSAPASILSVTPQTSTLTVKELPERDTTIPASWNYHRLARVVTYLLKNTLIHAKLRDHYELQSYSPLLGRCPPHIYFHAHRLHSDIRFRTLAWDWITKWCQLYPGKPIWVDHRTGEKYSAVTHPYIESKITKIKDMLAYGLLVRGDVLSWKSLLPYASIRRPGYLMRRMTRCLAMGSSELSCWQDALLDLPTLPKDEISRIILETMTQWCNMPEKVYIIRYLLQATQTATRLELVPLYKKRTAILPLAQETVDAWLNAVLRLPDEYLNALKTFLGHVLCPIAFIQHIQESIANQHHPVDINRTGLEHKVERVVFQWTKHSRQIQKLSTSITSPN